MTRARDVANQMDAGEVTPHIIPGVLYPAVGGNDINGTDIDTSHGSTYTYGELHTDGRKYYYTDIEGSKPINDPRIGAHFGSQRHKFKSLQLLEQETATHGENVYSVDGREWIRVTGANVSLANDSGGVYIMTSDTGTSSIVEITGYFNDINVLIETYNNNKIQFSVDGGTTRGGTLGDTTVSTPLASRYVDKASVLNLDLPTTDSTTLGIHTIAIFRNTASDSPYFGIELIAQDTTSTANRSKIQIPSQNVVSYGKKFTVSGTPHYDPFNGFTSGNLAAVQALGIDTNTSLGLSKWLPSDAATTYYRPFNGGRIIKWVDSSGTIKTSVNMMPPNAKSVANSASPTNAFATRTTASHFGTNNEMNSFEAHTTYVNEDQLHEVAKSWHFREFGNGNANGGTSGTYKDFSMSSVTGDSVAYVMDDGLTSMSTNGFEFNTSENFKLSASGKYFYITFIGTGLTLNVNQGGTLRTVAQNLPYGTHIFKLERYSNYAGTITLDGVVLQSQHANWDRGLVWDNITFHQPKKPPIPEDACVIADYMLMADYVANTSGDLTNISKGVRMISSSRDIFYDATSSSDLAYNHTSNLGTRNRGSRVRWGNIGSGGTDGPIITYFGHPKVDYHIGRSSDASERYHLKLTNSSGTLETTNVSGTTSSGSISNHEITNLVTSDGSAYFSSSKSDGVLGANKGELLAYPDDSTYDWLYFGDAYVATPIHSSHHYQTFETPFLHELVGGDRNMEQHNLVVSPDGKTWDSLTRDTSYIGNLSVQLMSDQGEVDSGTAVILDECRGYGTDAKKINHGNKDFAIAYDRLICLKDGEYEFHYGSILRDNSSQNIIFFKVNGAEVAKAYTNSANWSHQHLSGVVQLKRGDYVQIFGGYWVDDTNEHTEFYIKKLS